MDSEHNRSEVTPADERTTIALVVVSSGRDTRADVVGSEIEALLGSHDLLGPIVIPDSPEVMLQALEEADTQVVLFVGGTGLAVEDRTIETLRATFDREIPGFGELLRVLLMQQLGGAAHLVRACAGLVGNTLVYAMPSIPEAYCTALRDLILPDLANAVRGVRRHGAHRVELSQAWLDEIERELDAEEAEHAGERLEPVSSTEAVTPDADVEATTTHGQGTTDSSPAEMSGNDVASRPEDDSAEGSSDGTVAHQTEAGTSTSRTSAPPWLPRRGWKRAVFELGASVNTRKHEALPLSIEQVVPLTEYLKSAGQTAQVKLSGGRTCSLAGFPDLKNPNSKVLLVGWGTPLCEIVALHRFPAMVGACIDESHGLLPSRNASISQICEQVTQTAPPDTSGSLFALDEEGVWIQRDDAVWYWNGTRLNACGSPEEALHALVRRWTSSDPG